MKPKLSLRGDLLIDEFQLPIGTRRALHSLTVALPNRRLRETLERSW